MTTAGKILLSLRSSFLGRKPERSQSSAAETRVSLQQETMEVTPGQGPSRLQFLDVKNLGEAATFHAEGQIISSQNTNSVLTSVYPLGWGPHRDAWIAIPRGGTRQILIASIRDVYSASLFHMALIQAGPSAERHWARWNAQEQLPLPRFGLRVSIIAEGAKTPWTGYFSVAPEDQQGTGVRLTFRGLQGASGAIPDRAC